MKLSNIENLGFAVDAVVDEGMVLGGVLPDEELDGLLGGDAT